jgi:hypothetical protein
LVELVAVEMIIIFAGTIGRFPIGGHAWIDMQYLEGLRALGHEVYYLEECGDESWVYNWKTEEVTTALDYPTAYVLDCLTPIGLGDKWFYRAGARHRGMAPEEFSEVCSRSDLLIIRGAPLPIWRTEYDWPTRRVFIDVDPGFTQIKLVKGNGELASTIDRCEQLFTIAQRMGAGDCDIPTGDRHWHKTTHPIWLPAWPYVEDGAAEYFTSILQWRSYPEVTHGSASYGNKDKEFPKFIDLPLSTPQKFRMALTGAKPEVLLEHGWDVVPGWIVSETPSSYCEFIQQSRAEFGVAKQGYVATQGGWFSDRSVCYLASGRPVLVQNTGIAEWLPVGKGVLTFNDKAEALREVEEINDSYEEHRRAARSLAEQFFAAERVLPPFLEAAMG